MRFISIQDQTGKSVVINANMITNIDVYNNIVTIFVGQAAVLTMFTSVESAVDYIQRATPIGLGGS